jgi:hypothetical protein
MSGHPMKNMILRCVFLAALAVGLSVPASAGDLKLTMQNGRVTIIAVDVPLRQILQEWARVGQTKIVNGEKLSGPALTLQLVDTPERDALDILLRSASGYIAAPRPVQMAGAAIYDRVTIMATSRAPAATAVANTPPPPTFQRPPQPIDDSDEPINVSMPPPAPNQVVTPFPGVPPQPMQQVNPNGQPGPTLTAPRPGVLPPTNVPNGVPNPYQPVVRPGPGGGPGGPGGA